MINIWVFFKFSGKSFTKLGEKLLIDQKFWTLVIFLYIPIVIISGHGNIEIAVAAVKQGAYDFLEKPFNTDQLIVVIKRALEASRLRREIADLRRSELIESNMIGNSGSFNNLKSHLDKVTKSNSRVMLTGPAVCGKEIAARYIHANSERASSPFVSVSSASIESDKMEEVLFGSEYISLGVPNCSIIPLLRTTIRSANVIASI